MENEGKMQEAKPADMSAEKSTEALDGDKAPEGDKKRKPRFQRRDRDGGGRYQSSRGNNWRSRNYSNRKAPVSAEALTLESILAREDKPIVFDLSIGRDKLELNEWFKTYAPSKIRRSDGIGWIMVLSETINNEEKKFMFEREENHLQLNEEWRSRTSEPDSVVTFDTIKDLAIKHDCKGGKWICHPSGPQLDEIWQRTVLAMAYDKLAKGVIAVKISPINDLDIPGGNSRGGSRANDHVLCIINRDMTNAEQVLSIEKTLRAVPIKSDMQYKPNIYSQLGIYRNNKYKLRPTIYSSVKDSSDEGNGYKIESVLDANWSYSISDDSQTNINVSAQDLQASLSKLQFAIGQVNEAIAKMELNREMKCDDSKGKPDKKTSENDNSTKNEKVEIHDDEKSKEDKECLPAKETNKKECTDSSASGDENLSAFKVDKGKEQTETKDNSSKTDGVKNKPSVKEDNKEEKDDKKATNEGEKDAGKTIIHEDSRSVDKKIEEGAVVIQRQMVTPIAPVEEDVVGIDRQIVLPETKDDGAQLGKESGEEK